jgi:MFS superfamily sulfate permease-like transporter
VNYKAGARTQLAEMVTAGAVLATLLFISSLIGLMPQTVLAAVVVATTAGLLNPKDFQSILRLRAVEFWWSVIAFAGVVVFGTLQGILMAVTISIITIFYQANHPPIYAMGRKPGTNVFRPISEKYPEDETFPGLLLVKTEGRMTFASAPRLGERIWELINEAKPRVLLIDFSAVPDIEYTAINMLKGFDEKLEERGIALWLTSLNPRALDVVKRSALFNGDGSQRMFYNVEASVKSYLSM